jgi:hypothetical protein
MTVGSPGFLSPEQARGREVDEASDVFSLGAVLTYAATGEGPFGDGPDEALMYRVVHEPPDLSRVPDGLRWLIESCLAKKPGYRPTLDQLLDRLTTSASAASVAAHPGRHDSAAWLPVAGGPRTGTSGPLAPQAGPDGTGSLPGRTREPAVPRTGDRLPAAFPAGPGTPPGLASRRWWLPLAAVLACVALAGGVVLALTSSPGTPAPGPASPPALVVPTAAGATPGASGTAPPSSPGNAAPSRSATRPAGATSPAKTGTAGKTSAPPASHAGPSAQPTSPPPGATAPPSAGPTTTPATVAPTASPTHCVLFICS